MKTPWRAIAPVLAAIAALSVLAGCGGSEPQSNGGGSAAEASPAAHSHDVAGETCFICEPAKRDAGRLWCKEHARYEDRCWECQPQLEEKGRLYCEEHGLYEDECHICRPELREDADDDDKNSQLTPGAGAGAGAGEGESAELFCNEHHVPEQECGICQPQLASTLSPGDDLKVRFESTRSAAKAGIRTVLARKTEAQPSAYALCEVDYNQNEMAHITPLAAGLILRVLVDVGADVEAGDVLVELHSADVARAKSAFLSAVVDLNLKDVACERERRLAEKKISSDKEVQEADAACRIAKLTLSTTKQRLLNYGFTMEDVETIAEETDSSAVMLVRAPYEGTIVRRGAVVGEAVGPGDRLFTLANLETMWLSLSIASDRAHVVHAGLPVTADFGTDVHLEAKGVVTWVDTAIDERTRMLRARAVVDNSARHLKAGMFGDARLLLSDLQAAVAIPRDAVQRHEKRPFVFVKIEDDLYSLRSVTLANSTPVADYVAVLEGLAPGDPVVTTGAFTVMSEFLKSRLGAGCVDD